MNKLKKAHLLFLIVFLGFIVIFNNSSEDRNKSLVEVEENPIEIDHKIDIKMSALDPIVHVKGANWTHTVTNGTASGEGTWANPYVIKDKVIDANGADYGIRIANSEEYYFRIENCTVYNATIAGLLLSFVNNGTVIDNNVSFNEDATPSNNEGIGIWLSGGENNTIIGNTLYNNSEYGLYLTGNSINNYVKDNYIKNNQRHGLFLSSTTFNEFYNNRIEHSAYFGINLYQAHDNYFSGNIISDNNNDGIRFYNGDRNNFTENVIRNNLHGIEMEFSTIDNLVYKNYFFSNDLHAKVDEAGNYFNSSRIGNYWDNYTGSDLNFDGIGETDYNHIIGSGGAVDSKPIHSNPLHSGETIRIDETGINALNWSQTALVKNWLRGSGSSEDPYIIENLEINCEGIGNGIYIENSNESNYFIIRNCNISNSGPSTRDGGIYIYNSSNGLIFNNNCSGNQNGISLYEAFNHIIFDNIAQYNTRAGVAVEGEDWYLCENITIKDNNLDYNDYGAILERSYNLTVSNNTALICNFGFYNWFVDESVLMGNNAMNCTTDGFLLTNCNNNTLIKNIANNNSRHGIYVYLNSNGQIIRNNTANNNGDSPSDAGICLDSGSGSCNNNNISENILKYNFWTGMMINRADYNHIYNNLIEDNPQYGLYIASNGPPAHDNIIYNNSFIGNGQHVYDLSTDINYYNSSTTGNYWDDYSGLDSDGDGFGDDSYVIRVSTLRQDEMPIWSYSGKIYIDGAATGVGAQNWTWAASQPWCSGSGTSEDPYIISDMYLNVDNTGTCLEIQDSSVYFIVKDCLMKDAGTGWGIDLFDVNNGIFENNVLINNQNGINLWSCANNTFIGNNITFTSQNGINLDSSQDNFFRRNIIKNSSETGIYFTTSNDNNFTLNEVINSLNYGVEIVDTSCAGNRFYKNAFIDNKIHALDDSNPNSNYWNNSIIGNYWNNHSTGDADQNGIDNTQFDGIAGNAGAIDFLPIYGDPRHDGLAISIDDSPMTGIDWQYHSTRFWCSGSGTWTDPYIIEDLSINGQETDTGIEIQYSQTKYFIIRNCFITNTAYDGGIFLYQTRNATIVNNIIVSSTQKGIYLDECRNCSISDNHISETDESGIYLDASAENLVYNNQIGRAASLGAIRLNFCNNNTISRNYINHTLSGNGIVLIDSESNNLTDNIIENTISESGMAISTSSYYNILRNNSVSYSYYDGININSGAQNDFIDNKLFKNQRHGFNLTSSDNCEFYINNASNNGGSGISLNDCDSSYLSSNTLSLNNVSGLMLLNCSLTQIINNGESFNYNYLAGIYLMNSNQSTISGNVANNNHIGIVLNSSHSNIITGNTFLGNDFWKIETTDSSGNSFKDNDYGIISDDDDTDDDTDDDIAETPSEFIPIEMIIIIAIIGTMAVVGLIIVKNKTSGKKKEVKMKKDNLEIAAPKTSIKAKGINAPPLSSVRHKKAKKLNEESLSTQFDFSEEDAKDLEKTEKEVGVEEQEFICVVHKGPILGDNYLCPHCKTFYCVKCAQALKAKGEKCWSCGKELNVKIPDQQKAAESVPMAKSEKLEEYIENLNNLAQNLDEKFIAGDLSQEAYGEKKNLIGQKIGEAMGKLEKLKE